MLSESAGMFMLITSYSICSLEGDNPKIILHPDGYCLFGVDILMFDPFMLIYSLLGLKYEDGF